jgi:hypothetical protein
MSQHVFSVSAGRTLLDGQPFLARGLRCSNALLSDATTEDLIARLDEYVSYGVNCISVYWQGSRFGDVRGYLEDASLSPAHAARMARLLEAADARGIVVLVGCLYWGNSRAKWPHWTQREAEAAVANTVRWLRDRGDRHVFVDVDNEGMAQREAGFDNRRMLLAGKREWSECVMATNHRGAPPPEADLAIHHNEPVPGKPYIESEGSPHNVEGGYWGPYSKAEGLYAYLHVGEYTEEMKENQMALSAAHWARGEGYLLASTWLQAPPPQGPHADLGGYGGPGDPGVRWWMEFLREQASR